MHSRTFALFTTALVTALAAVLAYGGSASADGGTEIAGAPAVTPGVQQFGNTAAGSVIGCSHSQFWTLNVVAGDEVVIDWESASVWPLLEVFPVGTTDFSLGDTDDFAEFHLNSNGKAQSTFTAPTTGAMPVRFRTYQECEDRYHGPYDFLATVRHAVVVSFQRPARLSVAGTLQVGAHNPDGAAILGGLNLAIQARLGSGAWTSVGSASATGDPTPVGYQLPAGYRGRKAQVRAVASGPGFLTAASSAVTLAVQGPTGGGGGGGHKVRVTLKATPKAIKRLHRVHLKGHATGAQRKRVTIYQRQANHSHWTVEGKTRVSRKGKFGYSEVVHQGSRYYRACVGSSCSRAVYVRFRA